MNFFLKYVRRHPFSLTLVAVIWIVCLIPIPETPLSHVSFIDKWTHFGMYGLLTLILQAEYGFCHRCIVWFRFLLFCILAPIAMGGLVELAQAYLTNGVRSGDWLDFAANSTGVLLGTMIGLPVAKRIKS